MLMAVVLVGVTSLTVRIAIVGVGGGVVEYDDEDGSIGEDDGDDESTDGDEAA